MAKAKRLLSAYSVSGRVIDRATRKGAPGLRIEAWDKDLLTPDDPLGKAVTGEQGAFRIEFDESRFKDLLERGQPEIFFRIFLKDGTDPITETRDRPRQIKQIGETDMGNIEVDMPQTAGKAPDSTWSAEKLKPDMYDDATGSPGGKGTITGVIFYDTSGDATFQQDQELVIELLPIKLQPADPNAKPVFTSTGSDGRFTEVVDPGIWFVKPYPEIDPDALPDDLPEGLKDLEPDLPDSEAELPKLRLSEPDLASIRVNVVSSQVRDVGEIGYRTLGGFVRGIVFVDKALNQNPANQPRIVGLQVSLTEVITKTTRVATTDAQGIFVFDEPEPGRYRLSVESRVDAAKFGLGAGALTLHDDLSTTFLVGSGEEVTQDIGYILPGGDVRGVVFLDEDGDGRRFGNEPFISGVNVILVTADNSKFSEAATQPNGEYQFLNVQPPGAYNLLFSGVFRDPSGKEFTLTTPGTQPVTVIAGQTVYAQPAGYQSEAHVITGEVVFADGTPFAGLVVTLLDSTGTKELDTAVTDEHGFYVFKDREGDFRLRFPDPPLQGQLLTARERDAHVESTFNAPKTVYRLAADGGTAATLVTPTSGSIQESVADIASYMPTAQEVVGPVMRTGAYGAPGAPAPLRQVVEGALMETLGRKLKMNDPKAFLESLNRAFTLEQVEGRVEYKWISRTYAVQTELGGALSGAQASIYHRAKIALDDALPLLDGLYPLDPKYDPQEVEAVRAIVRKEFTELVNELGVEGGPRVQRVDDILRLLKFKLDDLRRVFGLVRANVITVEEEQNLTNFLVIRDYLNGLETAWDDKDEGRSQFTGTDQKFLGTQLVLLSRALSVVAESVDETYLVMDSVFLGPAERQTVRIDFPNEIRIDNRLEPILNERDAQGRSVLPPPMFVEELLSWVAQFATDEGPTLIQEGGLRGVAAIQPTADRLRRLVLGATQTNRVPHVGFSRNRVRRALSELADQLGEVEQLALQVLSQQDLIR